MENKDLQFDTNITVEEDLLTIHANGNYSLIKANNLFKLAIDSAVSHNKSKILVDVTRLTGDIPFFDRFQYSEFLSIYRSEHATGKISKIAVVGQEPIVDKRRFGETVAVNRGTNTRVFTDMSEASVWLKKNKTTVTSIPTRPIMKKKPGLLLLILSASILIISCSGKQSNEAEKRLVGIWEEEEGAGEIANLDFKITYSFESENKFKMTAKAKGQIIQSLAGSYEIKTDSLFLYYEGGVDNTNYSGRLIFNSDTKFALIDLNGELDFSKK